MFKCTLYLILKTLFSAVLKTLNTIRNCQRPVFSFGVSKHMHTKKPVKKRTRWSSKLRDNNGRKITLAELCFQMLDFGTSKSNSEVSKSNSKILVENYIFFSRTTLLQREPFLTMFYTINSSPLLVTK